MDLGSEIQKTNVGIRIRIVKMPCVPIFRKNGQLWLYRSKFAQKRTLGFEIHETYLGIRISILEITCVPIFRQNGQLWSFGPTLAQKWILGSKFHKSKSGFGINTSKIPLVPIFSQNGQILTFRSKFGEIAQLRPIFLFKYYWECCKEVGGGWNYLGGGEWNWLKAKMRWVEVNGAEWRWAQGLVIPIDEYNTDKEQKILIVFDDMIVDMISKKKLNSIVTELFIRRRKLSIFLVFITQSYFKVSKDVRLNSTQFFITKILNKRELEQIALNHSSDMSTRDFINIYKNYTAEPYSFLVNDAKLASGNPLRFGKCLFNIS